jgi:glycine cleavage system T protein (aminomethyltransferase)
MMTKMKTPLHEKHCQLGARMVDFNGWEMPLQYTSILDEHRAVRTHIGIFDVSHMGRVIFEGPEAEQFVDYISTNRIVGKKDGTATYTVFPNETGGCVDDAIIYKESATSFFTIVNAGNRQKDLEHFLANAKEFDVSITHRYDDDGILAVQGPDALALVHELFPESVDLKPFRFIKIDINGKTAILSRTGYTGEDGVEIYAPLETIPYLWDLFMEKGKKYHIQPIGLGARDTLRLEVGYALYGHELSETISPVESISSWTIKLKDRTFIGKEAIAALKENGKKRVSQAAILEDKGIAREGYPVFQGDHQIGVVTSGTMSPSCQQAIALILIDKSLQEGEEVMIQVRNKQCRAKIVTLPFYKK